LCAVCGVNKIRVRCSLFKPCLRGKVVTALLIKLIVAKFCKFPIRPTRHRKTFLLRDGFCIVGVISDLLVGMFRQIPSWRGRDDPSKILVLLGGPAGTLYAPTEGLRPPPFQSSSRDGCNCCGCGGCGFGRLSCLGLFNNNRLFGTPRILFPNTSVLGNCVILGGIASTLCQRRSRTFEGACAGGVLLSDNLNSLAGPLMIGFRFVPCIFSPLSQIANRKAERGSSYLLVACLVYYRIKKPGCVHGFPFPQGLGDGHALGS